MNWKVAPSDKTLTLTLENLMKQGCDAVYQIIGQVFVARESVMHDQNAVTETREALLEDWMATAANSGIRVPLLEASLDENLITTEIAALLVLYACHERADIRDTCARLRLNSARTAPTLEILTRCVELGCLSQAGDDVKGDMKAFAATSPWVSVRRDVSDADDPPSLKLSQMACMQFGLETDDNEAYCIHSYIYTPTSSYMQTERFEAVAAACKGVLLKKSMRFCGLLHGADVCGHRDFLSHLSGALAVPIAEIRIGMLLARPNPSYVIKDIMSDLFKGNCILYIPDIDALFEIPALKNTIIETLAEHKGITFLSSYENKIYAARFAETIHVRLEFAMPAPEERREIWLRHVPELRRPANQPTLYKLYSEYSFSRSQIERVAGYARIMGKSKNAVKDIEDVCCFISGSGADELAENTDTASASLKDYILPPEQMELYMKILGAARHHAYIMSEWGFGRRLPRGKGLVILLDGPPGTGKTLGALVLAAELKLRIMRIDMSNLVSKYVGETGANIKKVFEMAKRTNAILLIDEADALLSKRVAKQEKSTDRYANMEINILLQELECFNGIVILTTNLAHCLDEALQRRIQYRISFKPPNADDRARLWRSHIPDEAPVCDDIDYDKLGRRFELTGGQIKNAVLLAAYAACNARSPIAMEHLTNAAFEECSKAGQLFSYNEPEAPRRR